MKCPDYIEWIARKVDGSLPFESLEELDAHLKECALCRLELKLQKEIHQSLKQELPSGLSADFTQRVTREALALEGRTKKRWRLPDLLPVFAVAAAGILLVVFRNEVGQLLSPATQVVGDALAVGGTAVQESVADTVAKLPDVSGGPSARLQTLLTPAVTTVTAGAIALGTVLWSLARVRAYLRD